MTRIQVSINPKILRWAREEAGIEDIKEVEKKAPRYQKWEESEEYVSVPLGQLKEVANLYKRQVVVFMLDEVPESTKKPKDYRSRNSNNILSRELLSVLRSSRYLQSMTSELMGGSYWENRYDWLAELKNIEASKKASWLRRKLGDANTKNGWNYKELRSSIEKNLGILTFQFPIKEDQVDGFCLIDNYPFVIVVNGSNHVHRKIFTICHELAHIVRNTSGICLTDRDSSFREEHECNDFAGKLLISSESLVNVSNLEDLKIQADAIGLSRETYLRRLKSEKKIEAVTYNKLLRELTEEYENYKSKPKIRGGGPKPEVLSKSRRGDTCYNIILDGVRSNKISYTRAAGALELNVHRLSNEL